MLVGKISTLGGVTDKALAQGSQKRPTAHENAAHKDTDSQHVHTTVTQHTTHTHSLSVWLIKQLQEQHAQQATRRHHSAEM